MAARSRATGQQRNSTPDKATRGKTSMASIASNPETVSGFDNLIHERTRLAIVSALAANRKMTFNDLKIALQVSDGNLSSHARKLEDAGYVSCKKQFDGRVPRTEYTLTATGRKALKSYIAHVEALIKAMKTTR